MNGYLGVEQLSNLQTLALNGGSLLEGDDLGKLTQLRSLELKRCSTSYLKTEFFKFIAKLTALQSLYGGAYKETLVKRLGLVREKKNVTHHNETLLPGLMLFLYHGYLYDLFLDGKFEKLSGKIEFYPPNLLQLSLWECKLTDDPKMILEKLPLLQFLELDSNAYVGKKMVCFSGGFL